MTYKIIDSDNYAEHGIQTFFFSGGEPHVKLPRIFEERLLLFLKLRTWNDVGIAACLVDALRRQEAQFTSFIPYFPGARQDRTDGLSPLTAALMRRLLTYSAIDRDSRVFDPHSHSHVWLYTMPSDLNLNLPEFHGVIAPDEGAWERATDFKNRYASHVKDVIRCEKVRDFSTGRITGFEMPPLPCHGRYIIVDDICDGGATFNMLAESFKKDRHASASTLELWVSHGIFSKGVSNIDKTIGRIYTTDSWYRPNSFAVLDEEALADNPRVTSFPLASLFDTIMGESK